MKSNRKPMIRLKKPLLVTLLSGVKTALGMGKFGAGVARGAMIGGAYGAGQAEDDVLTNGKTSKFLNFLSCSGYLYNKY